MKEFWNKLGEFYKCVLIGVLFFLVFLLLIFILREWFFVLVGLIAGVLLFAGLGFIVREEIADNKERKARGW